jgi:serine/threonine protein kinase
MSENNFSNNEPANEGVLGQNQAETAAHDRNENQPKREETIQSKDYTEIKPLYTSRYGNSRVFTARSSGKRIVLKALKPECVHDAACRASLRQEYETTSMLDSKYVRKALDFVNIQGLGDCIVFEFIEGKTLAEHVRVGTLSEKQVKSILVEMCDGLQYLHRNRIVHSNLKPENVMVTSNDYHIKLIDIGIPETKQEADRELLIKEMEFVAPEIIKGEDFDSRADIYSLGKIMEFIGERNITRQYNATATHCTQFSKEQRFDTISEVRSAVGKGRSVVKIVLFAAVVVIVGLLCFIYVPKIKTNVEKERAERLAVDFAHQIEDMQAELPELCEKYALTSLTEPVAVDWSEDSLRYVDNLMKYFRMEEYKAKAAQAIENQRIGIENSRVADFDRLLLTEFKNTNDSLALQMKSALVNPSDTVLLMEARKWYGLRY